MKPDITSRRGLLRTAAAGAFAIMDARLVRGSQANSAVRVGLLGCGRRGSTDLKNILDNTGARLTALADLFPDQLEKARQRFPDASRAFSGPEAWRQIVESPDVDAVIVATPAWFHPQHLEAAVTAGKHVYCEKPVAVDVAGALRVMEIGKRAEGRVSLEVGFQIRSAPPFAELVRRIHAGALGPIVAGEAHYYAAAPEERAWPGASGDTLRLRNWIQDRVLSGDIIVEQNIHAIDICNWVLRGHPVKAVGHAGRQGRAGRSAWQGDDCSSHFDVVYEYPNGVHVSFNSTQFGKVPFEVNERFFGPRGGSESPYSGRLGIAGEEPWTWESGAPAQSGGFSASGSFSDNLAQADPEKQKGFIDSIASGRLHNQAAGGVEAALTAMLGRQAAYTGREVAWDELVASAERWDPKIDIARLA
jgi:myo-inositol 2-dehydrogenase / D-chiro-inositol 1-dehydrogenase